jgi:hypothetical protein
MPMRRATVPLAVSLVTPLAAAAPGLGGPRALGAAPAQRAALVDFDGDGFDDLAIGAPGENSGAGAVNVVYGTANGLPGAAGQVLLQGNPEDFDLFGDAVATGRFNDDDFDDLAVGVPGETVGAAQFAGSVTVFYGSAGGLGASGQTILQGNPEPGDEFGEALATVATTADGLTPLAVGVPSEDVGTAREAGAVNIVRGLVGGPPSGGQLFTQGPISGGQPEALDNFGFVLG